MKYIISQGCAVEIFVVFDTIQQGYSLRALRVCENLFYFR